MVFRVNFWFRVQGYFWWYSGVYIEYQELTWYSRLVSTCKASTFNFVLALQPSLIPSVVPRIKLRDSHMWGICFATEPYPQLFLFSVLWINLKWYLSSFTLILDKFLKCLFGYLVAKPTIDQKQEIGWRKTSCYSQIHWQQCEVIDKQWGSIQENQNTRNRIPNSAVHGPFNSRPNSLTPLCGLSAFTIFQHSVPHLSILKSCKDSKTLACRNSN